MLLIGTTAPNFKLPDTTGEIVELKSFRGRPVVLYFYPKANTSGCTVEACGFRDAMPEYDRSKVAVLGVSPDPVKAVAKFAGKIGANFPLLADESHETCEKYGVWQQKSMYGRKYMGVARTTFVIDSAGKVAHVFERVKPAGHEKQVLEWLRASTI